jgi:transcriptional regulator with AAA-type ATPase domain
LRRRQSSCACLQEREFQRRGGTRVLKANIRVIAATNRDLRKAVEHGDFREDISGCRSMGSRNPRRNLEHGNAS